MGSHQGSGPAGQDDRSDDSLHGGSGIPRRPRRHHRSGQDRGRGSATGTRGSGQLGRGGPPTAGRASAAGGPGAARDQPRPGRHADQRRPYPAAQLPYGMGPAQRTAIPGATRQPAVVGGHLPPAHRSRGLYEQLMSKLGLLVVHIRSADRVFWRNPASAFFTLALPVMFLILFSVLFGTKPTGVNGHQVNSATFPLAGIVTFSVIGACYTNLAIGMTFAREGGFLKRLRGTPLPPWVYLTARIIHAVLVAGLLVVIAVAFSALAYGVRIPLASVPPLVVSLVIGAACFSSLGLAVPAIIPN